MVLLHVTREISPLGIIVGLLGVVAVVGYDGLKRILKVGDTLVEGDKVVTGDQGNVVIGLANGESISLGSDAELSVDIANFGDSAYRDGSLEILQDMKDSLLAGQPANEVLETAGTRFADSTVYLAQSDSRSDDPLDDATIPDTGSNNPPADDPGEEPADQPGDQPGSDSGDDSGNDPGDDTGDDTGNDPGGTPGDDPGITLPEITVSDVSVTEPAADSSVSQGSAAGTVATVAFVVSLSEASSEDVTVHYRTLDGSATAEHQGQSDNQGDYEFQSGVLTIPAGETEATITLDVFGDSLVEGDENFQLYLDNVEGAVIGDNLAEGVIVDNEPEGQSGSDGGNTFGGADSTPGLNEATEGDDILHGTGAQDTISALAGDDVVFGAGGDDSLKGGHGNDSLIGGAGDDVLVGNLGDDVLLGQIGDDVLSGNSGDDLLLGGTGEDLLSGGGGSDVFAFTSLSDAGDVITDFKSNQNDAIDISEILDDYSEGDDLSAYINVVQEGGDIQLHVDPTGSSDFTLLVTLQDTASDLSTDPVDLLAEGSLIINSNTIV